MNLHGVRRDAHEELINLLIKVAWLKIARLTFKVSCELQDALLGTWVHLLGVRGTQLRYSQPGEAWFLELTHRRRPYSLHVTHPYHP